MPRTAHSLLFPLLLGGQLAAHQVEQHFLTLTLLPGEVTGRLEMDAGYALPELRSTDDETLPTGAWLDALPEVARERIRTEGVLYLQEVFQLRLDGRRLPVDITFAKWGTDWAIYFEQRPDTFARMVWDIRADYGDSAGTLEIFWNESDEGPALALQTISGDRELPLVTVPQREDYTLASVGKRTDELPEQSSKGKNAVPFSRSSILFLALIATLIATISVARKLRKKERARG